MFAVAAQHSTNLTGSTIAQRSLCAARTSFRHQCSKVNYHMQLARTRSARVNTALATTGLASSSAQSTLPIARKKLQGPTAVVTGGSQGVGQDIALQLAQEGYNVVIAARQLEPLQQTAARLKNSAGSYMTVSCDITQSDQVARLVAEVTSQYETVNLVVCNAGVCMRGSWDACTLEDYQSQLSVNFLGHVSVAQAFHPALKAAAAQQGLQRPAIAVVNSFAARLPVKNMAAYTASKFALAGWVDAIRNELASDGIDLIQVHPGIVDSDFLKRAQFRGASASAAAAEMRALLDSKIPLIQSPAQVASAVVDAVRNRRKEVMVGAPYTAVQAVYRSTGLNVFSI